jgi:hypothetical protein
MGVRTTKARDALVPGGVYHLRQVAVGGVYVCGRK